MNITEEEHHLVNITTKSHYRKNRSNYLRLGYEFEDLMNVAYEALLIATSRHDPEKAPLHYYQRIHIRGYLLNVLNRSHPQTTTLGEWTKMLPAEPDVLYDPSHQERAQEAQEASSCVLEHADEHLDVMFVKLQYVDNISFEKIGSMYNMTRREAQSLAQKGKRKIRLHMEGRNIFNRKCRKCGIDISTRRLNAVFCSDCVKRK